jgi:PAS domain S-box-containing protein
MWSGTQQWLNNVPLHDPVERRQAGLVQIMLISMICLAVLGILSSFTLGDNAGAPLDILICLPPLLCGARALVILRQGSFKLAVSIAIIGLMIGVALNCLVYGLRINEVQVSAFVLPITLAGLLAGRRSLLVTILLSITLVIGLAVVGPFVMPSIEPAASADSSAASDITAFILVVAFLGVFLDRFGATLRESLVAALVREQELQRIHASLEVRTVELSKAKEALEHELSIRQQVEAALIYERDLLHALMDNIPDTIYFKDTESRFIRINRAQAALLGVDDPEEAVGKTDFDFQTADLAQSFYMEERQIVETGQPLVDRVEFNPTPDGQPRWLSATKVPLIDKYGAVSGIIGVSRDITARQEVERLKSEFISVVSHELRTPLTSIRGSLGLLVGDAISGVPESVKSMLDVAHRNTQRLIVLINDLLDMEKIESGRLDFVCAPVELSSLLAHAIEANAAYGAQFGVIFMPTQIIPDAWVYVDSDRLMQVFTNLLSNAAKFSPPNSAVYVAISHHDRMLRMSIADRGPGIPKAFHSRIFGKFAQADSSDARQKGGTGLGLSIAKAIVERLGGEISFTTEIGAGTTFYVDLPEWHEEMGDEW